MSLRMTKTHTVKLADIKHDWYLVDADGQNLGRLAGLLATRLMGKHKPQYSPHLDMGDNIVVINASKVAVTGNKLEDKKYYRHSGYPGGIKETTLREVLEQHPERALEHAVKGMLPKNRLNDDRMARLKVYAGAEHPHAGQRPKPLKGDK
jgi:large subunit ribosomal protein L13